MRVTDRQMMSNVRDALSASLDLDERFKEAIPLLLNLVGADYGALFAPQMERPDESSWTPYNMTSAFLAPCSYKQMAQYDFVYAAVMSRVGKVFRDSEMIDRQDLKENMMYHRARAVGSPIEQVMAVMLHAGDDFQSGLSLYRARPRAFSEREQRVLQDLTPAMADAVRNCWVHAEEIRRRRLLQDLLDAEKGVIIIKQGSTQEIQPTPPAAALLDAWFRRSERSISGLPSVLLKELTNAQAARTRGEGGPWYWHKEEKESDLQVTFRPFSERPGDLYWEVALREVPHVPVVWQRRLSPKEIKVCARILRGWPDKEIAVELGCATNTVKQHAKSIYRKINIYSSKMDDVLDRKALQALALRYR